MIKEDHNTKHIKFSSLGSKKILANFNGGKITSDAGALLLREVDKQLGLMQAINNCIDDIRHPSFTKHDQKSMLSQRIFAIAMGYDDLNDHHSLRNDPLMQTITGRNRKQQDPLASASTLCRLENRIDRKSLIKISEVFI